MIKIVKKVIAAINPKFSIGDEVNYTNPQGVDFGKRKILGIEIWEEYHGDNRVRYFLSDSDTPWFPVGETCLTKSL
ncbi:MAG: hypothetical protein HRU77_01605 [Gammaproteobacteria bacterium]|nr:MAG: hypothetical protein HRU77_01605 [Gammaproteobacteria bacterium]